MHRPLSAFVVLAAFLLLAVPALAGGWATVRLDVPPGELRSGEPWRFGFMVLQHGVTPNSDVTPVVHAVHLETGDEVRATAAQEGPTGHFVAELTLPLAGEWSWEIAPEPFAGTTLPALVVRDQEAEAAPSDPVSLVTGSCALPGQAILALGEFGAEPIAPADQPQLAVSTATIDLTMQEMMASPHAIVVAGSAQGASPRACGEISGSLDGGELAILLQPMNTSDLAGLVILRPVASHTALSLYLFRFDHQGDRAMPSGPAEIVNMGEAWRFQPANLEIAPGTTVTWINRLSFVHAVTLNDPAHIASALIER